ncbi:MAG: hypothetical protein WBD40_23435 [Tepidisphaeraceae bacterium]
MGVFYLVDPLDDDDREWLGEVGVALPRGAKSGRNPTPAEIREVCDALEGFKTTYNASAKSKFWQADVEGIKGRDRDKGTLLNIDKWGGSESRRYKVTFEKGDPSLILQIVHGLSARCGPLVVTPDSGDTPAVVWPETDLKKLSRAWG